MNFDSLEVGHGRNEYGSVYLVIDNTNIKVYSYTNSLYQTFTHNLIIKDFITVNIKVGNSPNGRGTVTITTNGNSITIGDVIFFGSNGDVYASSKTVMTDVIFKYVVDDMKQDVYVFGDSYLSLADTSRMTHYLLSSGYHNMLLSGYGGANSANQLISFRNILSVRKPLYVVWLLGMNDPDTSILNASWKSSVDEVINYCKTHGITPILSTIPNTPTMNNVLKNEYVRNSGERYVDFAKSVNAQGANAVWYDGMLSGDNVHPTEIGAKTLVSRLLLDIPELATK